MKTIVARSCSLAVVVDPQRIATSIKVPQGLSETVA
jgi:hypothetical protein